MKLNIEKLASSLGQRYYTLSLMLNIFQQTRQNSIVQIGSEPPRTEYDEYTLLDIFFKLVESNRGASYKIFHNSDESTVQTREQKINSYLYKHYSHLSNDIKIKNINDHNIYNDDKIDVLILNDIHFPIQELISLTKRGDENYIETQNILSQYSDEDFMYKFSKIIMPSQERTLFEFRLFRDNLSKKSTVVLEGNDFPGGAQTCLVKRELKEMGFICLLDTKQSIWFRS